MGLEHVLEPRTSAVRGWDRNTHVNTSESAKIRCEAGRTGSSENRPLSSISRYDSKMGRPVCPSRAPTGHAPKRPSPCPITCPSCCSCRCRCRSLHRPWQPWPAPWTRPPCGGSHPAVWPPSQSRAARGEEGGGGWRRAFCFSAHRRTGLAAVVPHGRFSAAPSKCMRRPLQSQSCTTSPKLPARSGTWSGGLPRRLSGPPRCPPLSCVSECAARECLVAHPHVGKPDHDPGDDELHPQHLQLGRVVRVRRHGPVRVDLLCIQHQRGIADVEDLCDLLLPLREEDGHLYGQRSKHQDPEQRRLRVEGGGRSPVHGRPDVHDGKQHHLAH